MIASSRNHLRVAALLASVSLLALAICPASRAADKEKKPEKEKKEKIEPWVEIRTAHFIVASDGGEKTARRFAEQFETVLRIFQSTMPGARVTNGLPVRILVARDNQSFSRVVPEFPFSKTHEPPPGLFVAGPERTYIVTRANASGRFVFQDIYHDYANAVLKLSYRKLPPWIEEGFSSVYNSVTFSDRGARLERPDPEDMSVLFESPLLPLDLVFGVDRESPYYSPGNKDSVYFAESRVLLHYLIANPALVQANAVQRYLTAVQSGTDSLPAARSAFGDLDRLENNLQAYINLVNGPPFDFSLGGTNDAGGAARMLTSAESEARIADFLSLRGRDSDAEDKLEDAIMNEPSLAEAEQSMGFVQLKREDLAEAAKHFERAVQLDPKDALNYYGVGRVEVEKAPNGDVPPAAVDALEKSVALNADFAPAWYSLAQLYALGDETLPKALTAVKRATELAPGDAHYQSQMAAIVKQMAHPEEAHKAGPDARTARDRATTEKAGYVVADMSAPKTAGTAAPTAPSTSAKQAPDSIPRLERRTDPNDAKPAAAASGTPADAPKTEPAPASPAAPATSVYARLYSMIGTISEVSCAIAPQVELTLKSMTIALKLHADNFEKLSIKTLDSAVPAKEKLCAGLRGRTARISYHLVSDKAWDGEIQDLELRGP
jgi:tetratricopeptide (TPR) repeat protein